jgi:hypothetical protein
MPHRRLAEGATAGEKRRDPLLAPRRVKAVDEVGERIEPDVLGHRQAERKAAPVDGQPFADFVEHEAEHRPVQRVDREAGGPGEAAARDQLAEKRDVGVVVAEEPPVQRLEETPCRRGHSARKRGMKANPVAP